MPLFIVLGSFFIVAFLPKVPVHFKIVAQLIIGAVVYFGFGDTMFDLPMGDTLPISSLFGGAMSEDMGGDGSFNKLSLGVLGTALGLIMTIVATGLYAILGIGKKKDEE